MQQSSYVVHAIHDGIAGGRCSGTLRPGPGGFVFEGEAGSARVDGGSVRVELPYAGTTLRWGGAANRILFLGHPQRPGWTLFTEDRALLRDPGLRRPELAPALRRVRAGRAWTWIALLAVPALILGVPLWLAFNLDVLARLAARAVPVEWEESLGASAFAQLRSQTELVEDPQVRARLEPLVAVLVAAAPEHPYTLQFHVAGEASLNAFALPGGNIVVHSGLILKADSASELLGVLSHEISHVTGRHGLRTLITQTGVLVMVAAVFGDVGGLLGTLAAAAPLLLDLSYSRGYELEADAQGVALLQRAQVDPLGLATFFEKVQAEEARLGEGAEAGGVAAFLSTHPPTEQRMQRIREEAERGGNGGGRDLDAEFRALQDAVRAADPKKLGSKKWGQSQFSAGIGGN